MGITFNAEEIFQVAIRIEENGAAFYRKAADFSQAGAHKKLLESLATMEDGHKKIFLDMKAKIADEFADEKTYDPFEEAALYLEALADSHGGEGTPSVTEHLTGKETIQEIVDIALDLELKSILYYTGLLDFVPVRLGPEHVGRIIEEEKKHVAQLQQVKRQL